MRRRPSSSRGGAAASDPKPPSADAAADPAANPATEDATEGASDATDADAASASREARGCAPLAVDVDGGGARGVGRQHQRVLMPAWSNAAKSVRLAGPDATTTAARWDLR